MSYRALIYLGCLFFPGLLSAQNATEIVRKADQHVRGNTSVSELTIRIIRPTWSREMTMKAWSKGDDLAMILITSPAKDRGTGFLKRKKEVWNWLPAIERNVKLPPSMMSQNWMGTDFTNDDLVKEASIVVDYTHELAGEESIGGRNCFIISMLPRPEAAVVWGKVLLWIDKKDFMMMKAEYYDEEGELINLMTSRDVRQLGGRLIPATMEMIPVKKKGNKTVMTYTQIVFDQPLTDNFFSIQNIQNVK
ncbi:MAG: outer membrane lipoprotein-sorting protein [Bacteroidia bacterium]|nr:outer membrane lipoprotein-sorting protein [Bacteroidia bacterium]